MIESLYQTEMPQKNTIFELIQKTFSKDCIPTLITVMERGQARETIINPTYDGIQNTLEIYPSAQIEITFEKDGRESVFKINPQN